MDQTQRTNSAMSRRFALVAGASTSLALASRAAATPVSEATLAQAIEALRLAMVSGDGHALDRLLHERIIYMHSSGHSQTKANLLSDLAGKQFFASLANSEMAITVTDRTGIVSMTVDQVKNLPGGKTRASRIKVLQTWLMTQGRWILLARCSALMVSAQRQACDVAPVSGAQP